MIHRGCELNQLPACDSQFMSADGTMGLGTQTHFLIWPSLAFGLLQSILQDLQD